MQRINVTTCKVTGWASPQVIPNLFLSTLWTFLATSRCYFTYVWTNFTGSNFRIHKKFNVEKRRSCVNNWTNFSGEIFGHISVTITIEMCIFGYFSRILARWKQPPRRGLPLGLPCLSPLYFCSIFEGLHRTIRPKLKIFSCMRSASVDLVRSRLSLVDFSSGLAVPSENIDFQHLETQKT